MGLNIDTARKQREERKSSLYTLQEGKTKFYLVFPRKNEDVPWIEYTMHYDVGGKYFVCINPNRNNVMKNEMLKKHLESLNKTIEKECFICNNLKKFPKHHSSTKYLIPIVPLFMQPNGVKSNQWMQLEPNMQMLGVGTQIWEPLVDAIVSLEEEDPTNPEKAILFIVKRTGKNRETEYELTIDQATHKEPIRFSKEEIVDFENQINSKNSNMNVYNRMAMMYRDNSEMEIMLKGIKIEEEDEEEIVKNKKTVIIEDEDEVVEKKFPKKAVPVEEEVNEEETVEEEEEIVEPIEEDVKMPSKKTLTPVKNFNKEEEVEVSPVKKHFGVPKKAVPIEDEGEMEIEDMEDKPISPAKKKGFKKPDQSNKIAELRAKLNSKNKIEVDEVEEINEEE
jgi:hypothetical protein